MLALARQRAEAAGLDADLIVADAQRHPLPPAHFDWIQSRLGVMFFEDSQAAFANLHRATTPGAGLRFIAWRSADENPFMTTAERAIGDVLDLPPAYPAHRDSSLLPMASACSACCRPPAGMTWKWLRWTCPVRSPAKTCRPMSATWNRWDWPCDRCRKPAPQCFAKKHWQHSRRSSKVTAFVWMPPVG